MTWLTGVTSPKVEYAHLIRWEEMIRHGDPEKESQTHAGSVCTKVSRREGPYLTTALLRLSVPGQ